MDNTFKTVNKKATAEIIEKKSRFIANVMPVCSEDEALAFIQDIKKKHYDARHNCFAYIIEDSIIRFSDDGEPSKTAGKPILDVLQGNNLKNVVVVVTRYFGGVLLGTGGLVRAYSKAAKEGVLASEIVEMNMYYKLIICVDYSLIGKLQHEIMLNNVITIDTDYSDVVKFYVYVKQQLSDDFIKHIINITNNTCQISKEGQHFLKTINGNVVLENGG